MYQLQLPIACLLIQSQSGSEKWESFVYSVYLPSAKITNLQADDQAWVWGFRISRSRIYKSDWFYAESKQDDKYINCDVSM